MDAGELQFLQQQHASSRTSKAACHERSVLCAIEIMHMSLKDFGHRQADISVSQGWTEPVPCRMDSRSTSSCSPTYNFRVEEYQEVLQQLTVAARQNEQGGAPEATQQPEAKKPPGPKRLPRFEPDGDEDEEDASGPTDEREDASHPKSKKKVTRKKHKKSAGDEPDETLKKRCKKDDDDDGDDGEDDATRFCLSACQSMSVLYLLIAQTFEAEAPKRGRPKTRKTQHKKRQSKDSKGKRKSKKDEKKGKGRQGGKRKEDLTSCLDHSLERLALLAQDSQHACLLFAMDIP